MDGKLLSPLFICLQEKSGIFPKTVRVFETPNLHVVASNSSLLTKTKFKKDTTLLVDSWSAFNDRDNSFYEYRDISFCNTANTAKTTGIIQPLDVYFFRKWKNFVRKFSDRVLLDQIDLHLFQGNNISKLQTVTHTQFSAPLFKNFIRYSCFRVGYTDERPEVNMHLWNTVSISIL